MSKKAKISFWVIATLVVVLLLVWYLSSHSIPVFETGGVLADKEKSLMLFALTLAVIVVVPTFALLIWVAVRYNEKNTSAKKKYRPDFASSKWLETVYWGIPIIIIGILSYVAWTSSHSLSPYKTIASDKKTLVVQVVSLDWKWLFVYPEQNIASVNLAAIPVNTPIDFEVTSDTIMNSFWVPALGGQIYSMPGMITHLNEMALKTGDFAGSPANIAGEGFARMDFTIRSMNDQNFANWVNSAKMANPPLDSGTYAELSKPSMSVPVRYYSSVPANFLQNIAMKYMTPNKSKNQDQPSTGSMPPSGTTTKSSESTPTGASMQSMPQMGGMN